MVKLGDFGLAVQLEHSCSKRSTVCGTSLFMAPEVYKEGACLKSDVWSLGISVIEMAEGRHPYSEYDEEELKNAVVNGDSPSLSPSEWSSDLVDFVDACLVKDENERASVRALMEVSVSVAV